MSVSYSEPIGATLALQGVWLHDPQDPAGTARNLRYGRGLRSLTLNVASALSAYAGRTLPVADYGETEGQTFRVQGQVPNGADMLADLAALRALVRLRRPLVVRDNRGRAMLAHLSDYQETDQPWGTLVAILASEVGGVL